MPNIVNDITKTVLICVLQLALGYVLSVPVRILFNKLTAWSKGVWTKDILILFTASLVGIILPLDSFGIIIVAALLVNVSVFSAAAVFCSNSLFNSFTPYIEINFLWRPSIPRIILAVVIGLIAGIAVRALRIEKSKIFRAEFLSKLFDESTEQASFKNIHKSFLRGLEALGIFLILGSILDALFRRYLFLKVINWVYGGFIGSIATDVFAGKSITSPTFILAATIIAMFMNLLKLTSAAVLTKVRGLILYLAYFAAWCFVLLLKVLIF